MKKIFHPFLLPLFPVLAYFNYNFDELFLENLFLPVASVIFFVFAAWLALDLFIKNQQKSAVVASLSAFGLLSLARFVNNPALNFSDSILPQGLISNRLAVASIFLLLPAAIFLFGKLKKNFRNLTFYLNIFSVALLIFPFLAIAYKQTMRLSHNISIPRVVKFTMVNKLKTSTLPDIYYIILDRYAGGRTLKDYYGFDNSGFENFLIGRGFYVATESSANYSATHSSLSSSLNLRYHDDLLEKISHDAYDKTPYYKLIENSETVALLKMAGYKFFNFGSMWDTTRYNKQADFNYVYNVKTRRAVESSLKELAEKEKNPLASFLNETLKDTLPGELSKGKNYWRISIDQMLELSKFITMPGPKFVFVHSLLTHPPYVYDRNGYPLPQPLEGAGFQKEYIEQMIFANRMIENLIDAILQRSAKPPVIILQADEGPFPQRLWSSGGDFNWREATADEMKEKMGILNAYYLPNAKKDLLYPSISPVNSFRVIFNLYFGENLPLLPDKNWVAVSRGRPYDLIEITDLIK